jgi:FMN phosphatase YigB (HAD superfamily)
VNLVLFDLGGTLIDDPFEGVLREIRSDLVAEFRNWKLEEDSVAEFLASWREANLKSDHPFASHFLQEETWIAEALVDLYRARAIPPMQEIPLLSLTVLRRYRELAAIQIGAQPQLAALRRLLEWLRTEETVVGVASNDREFATRTMLILANLDKYMEWVFTSEGLSKHYAGAEKPAPEFFQAIFSELGRPLSAWDSVFYVGDSEKNDIIPAHSLGIRTVRFLNKGNPKDATWLDTTLASLAEYQCTEREQLQDIFRSALSGPKSRSSTVKPEPA